MAPYDEQDLIDRAIRAYRTRQRRGGYLVQQPSASSSRVKEHAGQVFVALENANGVMAAYKLKDDGHLEYVQPGADGTYTGTCIVCMTPTDTALAFQGEAEWIISGLLMLGIPGGEAEATAHAFWSERDPTLRKGEVPGGIVTETIRVCRSCAQASKASFPAPALAIPGAAIPVVGQRPETYLQPA